SPMMFIFSSRRRHTIFDCDWSSDVCSSDLSVDDATLQTILAGVLGDDRLQRRVIDAHLVLAEAVPLALTRPEVATCDRDLLVGGERKRVGQAITAVHGWPRRSAISEHVQ